MFHIKIKRKALRKLSKLDEKRKAIIKRTALILKINPIPYKKLDI